MPEPGSGQVQVVIEAAATSPLDMAIASGALAALGEHRFPLTLGMAGAGTVTAGPPAHRDLDPPRPARRPRIPPAATRCATGRPLTDGVDS